MNSGEYESYVLKGEELKLLLGGLGVKQLNGLLENDKTEEISRELQNRTLLGLYQKEMIHVGSQGIMICPKFTEIFSVLRTSGLCISVHVCRSDVPVRCCYISKGRVVMMEKCQSEQQVFKVSCWKQRQWLEFLGDSMEAIAFEAQFSRKTLEKVKRKWYDGAEEYFQEEGMAAVLTLQGSLKPEIYQRILVQEAGLETWMILQKRESSVQQPYSREELYNVLGAWMGGKNDTGGYLYSGN